MLVVCCCWPIGVLSIVVELLRFPVLLVGFDGTALDGEYDCCAYREIVIIPNSKN